MTATNFRKHLFEVLEQSLHGEPVEITYKGSRLKLTPAPRKSKLENAVRRNALLVDFDSIVESDPELMAQLEEKWRREYEEL